MIAYPKSRKNNEIVIEYAHANEIAWTLKLIWVPIQQLTNHYTFRTLHSFG